MESWLGTSVEARMDEGMEAAGGAGHREVAGATGRVVDRELVGVLREEQWMDRDWVLDRKPWNMKGTQAPRVSFVSNNFFLKVCMMKVIA